jgi:thiosulfate dehydrogenase [quinone] large subunit
MTTNGRGVQNVAGLVVTGIRIVLGIFWLLQITWKPPASFGCPDAGLCLWLNQEVQHPLIPLYADFVRVIVLPNVSLFGWMTTIVEVGIGLSLLLGLFTRLGALVGVAWSINLLIGLANVPNEQGWYYGFLILLNLLFVGLGASGQLSIDRARGWQNWWGRAAPALLC